MPSQMTDWALAALSPIVLFFLVQYDSAPRTEGWSIGGLTSWYSSTTGIVSPIPVVSMVTVAEAPAHLPRSGVEPP